MSYHFIITVVLSLDAGHVSYATTSLSRSLLIGLISCWSPTSSDFFRAVCLPEYHCSISSIVCGSGRFSVSGSSRVSRPAAVDRPPNSRPGNHGSSFAYTRQPRRLPLNWDRIVNVVILYTIISVTIISLWSANLCRHNEAL